MRNIKDVIKLIGNSVVTSEKSDEFQDSLDRILKKLFFTAPEAMYLRWDELQDVIFEYLPRSMLEWTDEDIKIVLLFSGKSEEFIKNDIESRIK